MCCRSTGRRCGGGGRVRLGGLRLAAGWWRFFASARTVRTITPHSGWEKRVRARCHSEISARGGRQMRTDTHMARRLSLVDVAALMALCVYLPALLQHAARLGRLTGRIGDQKPPANPLGQKVGDLDRPGNMLRHGPLAGSSKGNAPCAPGERCNRMADQRFAFHPTTTSSCFASGGMERNDSSRRCSRIKGDRLRKA